MTPSAPHRTAAAVVVLLLLATWLEGLGEGVNTPALGSWRSAGRWYDAVGPELAALAAFRLLALALVVWNLAALALQLLANLPALRSLRPFADRLSPGAVRRLGHGLASLSLTAGLAAPAAGGGTPLPPPPAGVPEAPVPADPDSTTPTPTPGTATMRIVPAEDDPAASTGTEVPDAPAPEQPAPVPAVAPEGLTDSVVVAPGDSLWSLAVEEVSRGGDPRERDVAAHWRRLVEANRSRLVDPTNPDLIDPGQLLTLPSPVPEGLGSARW